jgi:hypothetical protein
MNLNLTRIITYLTFVMYLIVGAVALRTLNPDIISHNISIKFLAVFSNSYFKTSVEDINVVGPELKFEKLSFNVESKKSFKKTIQATPIQQNQIVIKSRLASRRSLPFYEPVNLSRVSFSNNLPGNQTSFYKALKAASPHSNLEKNDEVTTTLASSEDPDFFEYPKDNNNVKKPLNTQTQNESDQLSKNVEGRDGDSLIAFDYSKAIKDIKGNTVPVTTNASAKKNIKTMVPLPIHMSEFVDSEENIQQKSTLTNTVNKPGKALTYQNIIKLRLAGINLKKTTKSAAADNLMGFEIRPQDDLSESLTDYNKGEIIIDQKMAQPKMTRNITLLKHGYSPTNTELILEEGVYEVTIPMIEESVLNELMAPFESRGPIGAVLIELDENVESSALDVPYSKVFKLDEKMQVTDGNDFTYQLFIGVKAGNSLLSFRNGSSVITSKIIHVHENEIFFESNFLEDVEDEKITLVEEDLLGREKNPLIISSDVVKEFSTEKRAQKVNNNTYKTDFEKISLAGRKYIELGHQEEPVFIGFKDTKQLEVPSEDFMRYVLSRFESFKMVNYCLIQVNLTKKAVRVDMSSESVGHSLQLKSQILDSDGKFYNSLDEKSHKIFIAGESNGQAGNSQDGKVNLKITYQDGSHQYLGSYCSPNTYLVEQL